MNINAFNDKKLKRCTSVFYVLLSVGLAIPIIDYLNPAKSNLQTTLNIINSKPIVINNSKTINNLLPQLFSECCKEKMKRSGPQSGLSKGYTQQKLTTATKLSTYLKPEKSLEPMK